MRDKQENPRKKVSQITQRLKQGMQGKERDTGNTDPLVRKVLFQDEMDEVYRIVHDSYLERGYIEEQPDGKLIHYPHLDGIPETIVLAAVEDGRIVGTNSITMDGPCGLHVDADFKEECDRIRAEGRKLASSWRIATRSSCRSERKTVMRLIQETVDQALDHGIETMLFTFNPRHEKIYRKLLNLTTIARSDGSIGSLSHAPAVLMRVDEADIPARWRKNRPSAQENTGVPSLEMLQIRTSAE